MRVSMLRMDYTVVLQGGDVEELKSGKTLKRNVFGVEDGKELPQEAHVKLGKIGRAHV